MNEWIEFNGGLDDLESIGVVGLLVETDSGKQFLVGDANAVGGVCGDLAYSTIVRYMRVWSPS